MSEYTAGVLKIRTDVDGDKTPAQLEKLGKQYEKAGDKAGDGFAKNVEKNIGKSTDRAGKDMEKGFAKSGEVSGEKFSKSLDKATAAGLKNTQANLAKALSSDEEFAKYAKNFKSGADAQDALGASLDKLTGQTRKYVDEQGKLQERSIFARGEHTKIRQSILDMGSAYDAAAEKTRSYAEEVKRVAKDEEDMSKRRARGFDVIEKLAAGIDRARGSNTRFGNSLRNSGSAFDVIDKRIDGLTKNISKPWKNLDNDVKLVIGLIASAGDQIAVLGSAIGGGLFAVGGAVAALGVGVAAVIPIFKALTGEIDDLPPSMQGVASEFKGLQRAFGDIGGTIAAASFKELGGVFTSLQGSVKKLTPAMALMGETVGKLGQKFAKGIAPGTEGLEDLNNLVFDSIPIFESLATSAGTVLSALVKGLGKANPLTEQLAGYVKRLANQFNDFVRSTSFDDWIAQTSVTWEKFGGLLDAVGRSLNNLSNADSVARTHDLLDGLTEFIPTLEKILTIFGNTNIIGLFVQALVGLGDAFAPLLDAMVYLSEALGEALMPIIESAAQSFAGLAIALTPVAYAAAALVDALPPEVLSAIGVALGVVVSGLIGLKILSSVSDVIGDVTKVLGKLGKVVGSTTGAVGLLGKAGLWGAAIGGMVLMVTAIKDLSRKMADMDGITSDLIASNAGLEESYDKLNGVADGLAVPLGDIDKAIKAVGESQEGAGVAIRNVTTMFKENGQEAMGLIGTLHELDDGMEGLPVETQAKKFQSLTEGLNLTDEQMGILLKEMPKFSGAIASATGNTGELATEQDILSVALGGVTDEQAAAEAKTREHADALAQLQGKAEDTSGLIDDLADAIRNFGSATLDTRSAQRDLVEGFDEFTAALTESGKQVNDAGTDFNTLTEAGREQQEMFDGLVGNVLDVAASRLVEGASLADVTAEYNTNRDALIKQAEAAGLSEDAAKALVDQLGLTPESITTLVETPGMQQALADAGLYIDELGNIVPLVSTTVEVPGGEAAISTAHDLDSAFAVLPGVVPTEIDVTGVAPALANVSSVEDATGKLEKTTTTNVAMTGADGVVAAAGKIEGAVGAIPDKDVVALSETGSSAVVAGADKVEAAVKKIPDTDKVTLSETGGAAVVTSAEKVKTAIEKIPQSWTATIKLNGVDNAVSGADDVRYAIEKIKSKTVTITTNYVSTGQKTATGGIFSGAQTRIIGEAGPEAVVPLNRALSRVDPSVRWLSALAQGKQPTQVMASGGVVGSGRTINIEAGAIQVNGGPDPRRTAQEVVNRITEKAVG